MKMKKLLAGVLSAAMVATMIPASMAFSSVSAAPEDSLVASYDFTTSTGTGSWTDATWSAVGEGVTITSGTGAVITGGDDHSSIYTTNALKDNATNGFSVVMNVAVTDNATNFGGLFGFASDAADVDANFFNVTGSGTGIHHTYTDGFYDIVSGSTVLGSTMQEYAITVSDDQICIYVNGSQCVVYNHDDTDQGSTWPQYPGYHIDSTSLVNSVDDFVIGYLGFWEGATATVQDVALYSSVLTEEEIADMSGIEPEEVTLLNEYDLTTVEGRTAWTASSDEIKENENGITFTTNGQNDTHDGDGSGAVRYSIANPYLNSDSNTMTIVTDVKTGDINIDYFATLYGFYNNSDNNLFGLSTNGRGAHWNYTQNGMGYFDVNAGTVVDMTQDVTRLVMVVGNDSITIYANGKYVSTITNSDRTAGDASISSTAAGIKLSQYFVLGQYANTWWLTSADTNFKYVAFYTGAMSADQVAENYAQSIADTLNITMRGRQAGTIDGETAVRFVANLDQDAINDNEAITKLGWAAENGTTVTENATGYMLNTVTSDSNLAATGKYAYTYVQATEDSVAVLPCVQITVNGNAYWFAYDGISGSAVSTEASAVVSAIDVEGIFAAAAENTLA